MEQNFESEVSELFARVQGNRSLRQFADVLGISVSSLSRIRAGLIRPKKELLQKIVANSAEPVTLADLILAFDRLNQTRHPREAVMVKAQEEARSLQAVITMGLLVAGYGISSMNENPNAAIRGFQPDLVVETNALTPNAPEKTSRWAFDFVSPPSSLTPEPQTSVVYRFLSLKLRDVAAAYYLSQAPYDRFSFVTTNREVFAEITEKWSGWSIQDELSVVLVDPQLKTVIDEFIIPNTTGKDSVLPFQRERRNLLHEI